MLSLQFLPEQNHLTLVDASRPMLDRAKSNTRAQYLQSVDYVHGDILHFESAELYDVVLCVGVLAHVPDTEALVARIACLLKPGGRCVFQFTDATQFLSKLLHWLLAFRRRFPPRPTETWEYTKTYFSELVSLAARKHLRLLRGQHHLVLLPGMRSVFPGSWLAVRRIRSRPSGVVQERIRALLLFEKHVLPDTHVEAQ